MFHKQKNTKRKRDKYAVNTKLYILLTTIFGIIALIAFTVMCIEINSSLIVAISSAIISISGGGLASVIVAWLLDIANCKAQNIYLYNKEKSYLDYILMFIDELFQSFADACSNGNVVDKSPQAPWDYWYKELAKNNFNKDKENYFEVMLSTYVSLNQIVGLTNELNSGELKDYIVYNDSIISEILILQDTCIRIRGKLFAYGETKISMKDIEYDILTFNDVLSTIIPFAAIGLDRKSYSPSMKSHSNKSIEAIK